MYIINEIASQSIRDNSEAYKVSDRHYLMPIKISDSDYCVPSNDLSVKDKLVEAGFTVIERDLTNEEKDFINTI